MHLPTPKYLATLRFDDVQAATLRSLGEYQGKQQRYTAQPPQTIKDLHQIVVVESIESSNRLEDVGYPLTAEVSRYPQRNAQEPFRIGDRRLP